LPETISPNPIIAPIEKAKNKASGLRAGLPDLLVIINKRLVFIEMKRNKGGKASPEQMDWLIKLSECENVFTYVCEGFEKAKKVIDFHLKLNI